MVQSKHRLAKREASCDKLYHVLSSELDGLHSVGGYFIAQLSLQNSGLIALNEPLFVRGEDRYAAVYLGLGGRFLHPIARFFKLRAGPPREACPQTFLRSVKNSTLASLDQACTHMELHHGT